MADPTVAQDLTEPFDVVTAEGLPTGVVKARGRVHRDGDWHRAIHVWICGIDDSGPFLTFQRRSLAKDTFPGRLDATVGGHYRAGETLEQTLRETEEEIGIAVDLRDLRPVGMRICVNESEAGIRDRELQDVFLLRDERPLPDFRPHPAELAAIVRVPLRPLLDLLADDRDEVPARQVVPGSADIAGVVLARSDFILRADRYPYRVAIAATRLLAGERHIAV